MEDEVKPVSPSNERSGATEVYIGEFADHNPETTAICSGCEYAVEQSPTSDSPTVQATPEQVDPDLAGPITPEKLRRLRGRYMTVKHIRLECGHLIDVINEPKNNCHECWYRWFVIHPQLVETADQFYRTQGKGPLIAMRGKKFFKFFSMFMVTIIKQRQEEENVKTAQSQESEIRTTESPST